jgi:hypothetical protein
VNQHQKRHQAGEQNNRRQAAERVVRPANVEPEMKVVL